MTDPEEIELELQRQWHENVCACSDWPGYCATYGVTWRRIAPDTFTVESVLALVTA